tara:strand:- start:694 stop:861 length:168 start_codon:yes stop_codon:yes gene_type:complete
MVVLLRMICRTIDDKRQRHKPLFQISLDFRRITVSISILYDVFYMNTRLRYLEKR